MPGFHQQHFLQQSQFDLTLCCTLCADRKNYRSFCRSSDQGPLVWHWVSRIWPTHCVPPPTSTSNGRCPVYTASPVWHWESRLQVMTWSLSLSLLHRPQNWGPHAWASEGFIKKKRPKHPIYPPPHCEIRKVINNKCQLHSSLIY